jgi:hypothetical protein
VPSTGRCDPGAGYKRPKRQLASSMCPVAVPEAQPLWGAGAEGGAVPSTGRCDPGAGYKRLRGPRAAIAIFHVVSLRFWHCKKLGRYAEGGAVPSAGRCDSGARLEHLA